MEYSYFRNLSIAALFPQLTTQLALFALANIDGYATMSAGCLPQPFGLRLLLLATHY